MFANILLAHDGTPGSDLALDYAIALAKRLNSKLTVCHATKYGGTYAVADPVVGDVRPIMEVIDAKGRSIGEHARDRAKAGGIDIAVYEVSDAPSRAIATVAKDIAADLLVMGNHGNGMIERLFEPSVSGQMLHDFHVPLLIVPHDANAAVEP